MTPITASPRTWTGEGINKAMLDRSAPSLWNIGFFDTLLWDGSKSSLEEQLIGPSMLTMKWESTRPADCRPAI